MPRAVASALQAEAPLPLAVLIKRAFPQTHLQTALIFKQFLDHMKSAWLSLFIIALALQASAKAEDGYRLWLRYDPLQKEMIEVYQPRITSVVAPGGSATMEAI